jgi:hypothetical protein
LQEDTRIVHSQNAKLGHNIENLRVNNSTLSELAEKDGNVFRNLEAHYRHFSVVANEKLMKAKADCKKKVEVLEVRLDLQT